MFKIINVALAAVFGGVITFSLFFLMQFLISSSLEQPEMGERRKIAEITIPEPEIEIQRVEPKPDEPEVIEDIPDLPEVEFTLDAPSGESLTLARVAIDVGGLDTAASLSAGDGEFLPIVRVNPQYPQRALSRGIEGWCQVMFTVTQNGTVVDQVIVDSEPPNIFNNSCIRAVGRYKYNPRTVDGVAIDVPGVQILLSFKLDE